MQLFGIDARMGIWERRSKARQLSREQTIEGLELGFGKISQDTLRYPVKR